MSSKRVALVALFTVGCSGSWGCPPGWVEYGDVCGPADAGAVDADADRVDAAAARDAGADVGADAASTSR